MATRRRPPNRVRHPLHSLFLLVVVVAAGWFGWEHKHLIVGDTKELLTSDQRAEIREQIVREFRKYPDFLTVRAMAWRPREQRYRLDIQVHDTCPNARDICFEIAAFVESQAEVTATVVAVDSTGRELGRAVT